MRPTSLSAQTSFLGTLLLAVFYLPVLSAAQEAAQVASEGTAAEVTLPQIWAQAGPGAYGEYAYAVSLEVDGNISGRLSAFDPSGTPRPVRGRVHFVRDGAVVASARSDERGNFQVTGLRPGVYSVVVVSRDGFGARSVVVRPFDESAARKQPTTSQASWSLETPLSLYVTLVPAEEFHLLASLLNEEQANLAEVQPVPSSVLVGGGGGGGGGGGLGSLMGFGGLAGLAGLGGRAGGDDTRASPTTP